MISMPYETTPQHGISARRLIPLGLLVAAGIAFVAVGGHHYLTFAALAENRDWLSSLVQRWGFVAALLYIATRAGLGSLAQRAGPLVGKLEAGFRADAFSYLLVLRLIFIFPFWLVNLVPALVGVRLPTFILATFLGIIPGAFVYASLGSGLGNVVGEPGLGVLLRPSVLGPIVGLVILALIPVGYKRWRTKRPA
jgi:uncharacterized membrane protein YdjX (TVP38/TMEM64 family)